MENKNKFTPGPWRVSEDCAIEYCTAIVASDGPFAYVELREDIRRNADPKMMANAALIAAAPDMYAFIEEIANRDTHAQKVMADCVMAKSIIKKAIGE